jgi:predicted enzyme related to lactoylglutathione lyase
MANPFVHVELQTQDPAKARGFYKGLFDWELQDVPGMDYTMINVGQGTGGGIMKNPMPGAPSHWLAYVQVDDLTTSTAKAKSLGATVLMDQTEVPGFGWFSMIQDPTGAVLGLWQPRAKV